MPAAQSPKPAKNKQPDPAAQATPEEPAPDAVAESATDPAADASSEDTAEEFVPQNRAERRAKGKTHGQVQVGSRGKATRSTGPTAGPRMWANRRSG